jgi:hypothetical protein
MYVVDAETAALVRVASRRMGAVEPQIGTVFGEAAVREVE